MRKPKRKRSKFVFRKKEGKIICNDASSGFYTKHVSEIMYMGDFGYHHAHINWTVFHVPTGLDICYCNTQKKARITVKKLYAKVWSGGWTGDAFKTTFELQVLVSQIKARFKTSVFPFTSVDFIANPDDDIPF